MSTLSRMLKVAEQDYRFRGAAESSSDKLDRVIEALAMDWADPSFFAVVRQKLGALEAEMEDA